MWIYSLCSRPEQELIIKGFFFQRPNIDRKKYIFHCCCIRDDIYFSILTFLTLREYFCWVKICRMEENNKQSWSQPWVSLILFCSTTSNYFPIQILAHFNDHLTDVGLTSLIKFQPWQKVGEPWQEHRRGRHTFHVQKSDINSF